MTILNRIESNWSRPEREKLNNNWGIIERYLSGLQGQINILTGEVDVQAIIDQLNDILNQGNIIIADLETVLSNAATVITSAQNATEGANNAAQTALDAVSDIQTFINQLGNAETYDNSKLYKINNFVEFNGSGFICVQETQGNTPPTLPTKRNDWWQLLAQRGVDGSGSISKVAGKSPEVDGNVPLSPEDIGAASSEDLTGLQKTITEHLAEKVAHVASVVRDLSIQGEQIVTLPFKAKFLSVTAFIPGTSHASWGSAHDVMSQVAICHNPVDNNYWNSANLIFFYDGMNGLNGKLKMINENSITIEWTSTLTGTAYIFISAQTH